MIRLLVFFLIIVAAGVGVAWLADHPGALTLNWQGLRIQTSLPVLAVVATVLAVVVYLLSRIWGWLVNSPSALRISRRFKQTDRGYNVLTEGLAAAMTGDARTALKAADRAEKLLGPGSATQLLRAQAAQMAGDEALAEANFNKLLENPDTEIVGLRGLLALARMQDDQPRALELALTARKKRPAADWAVRSLFDLQVAAGSWTDAARTVDQGAGNGVFDGAEKNRLKAVLHVADGQAAQAAGDERGAMAHARAANKAAPDLVPATVLLARLRLADGAKRRARSLVTAAYQKQPHPELMQVFLDIEPDETPAERVRRLEKLSGPAATHPETLLAKAIAAAADDDDNATRLYLQDAIAECGDMPDQRICREMVALEERTPDGAERARDWLRRLASAPAAPGWTCSACGEHSSDWQATCPSCGVFDGLNWLAATNGNLASAGMSVAALPVTGTVDEADAGNDEGDDVEVVDEDEIIIDTVAPSEDPEPEIAPKQISDAEREEQNPAPVQAAVISPDLPAPDGGVSQVAEPTIEEKARAAQ